MTNDTPFGVGSSDWLDSPDETNEPDTVDHDDHGPIGWTTITMRGERIDCMVCEQCGLKVPRYDTESFDEIGCESFATVAAGLDDLGALAVEYTTDGEAP